VHGLPFEPDCLLSAVSETIRLLTLPVLKVSCSPGCPENDLLRSIGKLNVKTTVAA
jgi:hypothetical protein